MHLVSLPGACVEAGKDEYLHGQFLDSSRLAT
jgi:hypothetical protein